MISRLSDKPYLVSLLLLMGVLLLNCSSFSQNTRQRWQSNKQLWEGKQLFNYKFTLEVKCFCGGAGSSPVLIEVRDGVAKSFTNIRTSEPVEFPFFSKYDTIPKLFSLIERCLGEKLDSFSVAYDATLGYPKKITIDERRDTADDELTLKVTSFEILR